MRKPPGPPPERRPPQHLSHSSRETLFRCAKAYYLSRIAKAPARPALWLAGGSAVHKVTEQYDILTLQGGVAFDVMAAWLLAFAEELDAIREREPRENHWRSSKAEDIAAWNVQGPAFVQSYIDWRKRAAKAGWEIWTTPDGQPAIELDVGGMLPGCPVEIKGYVDRVFIDTKLNRLVVLDLKSGKRPPKNGDQFGTYAALLEAKYHIVPQLGVPFMNRKGTLGMPHDLLPFTREVVGAIYAEAWAQIEAGDFPANGFPGECFICDVSAACAAQNGPLAHLYDPAAAVPF